MDLEYDTCYRIFNHKTGAYEHSSNSARTVWMRRSAASTVLRHLPEPIRSHCEIVEFYMIPASEFDYDLAASVATLDTLIDVISTHHPITSPRDDRMDAAIGIARAMVQP